MTRRPKRQIDDLLDTIKSIGYGLKPEYDMHADIPEPVKAGPNSWDQITKADFGLCFDYRIIRRGGNTIIDPSSNAALEWLYRFLPADAPRYGGVGYVIESRYVSEILEAMAQDGLLSEDDYIYNMNMEEQDQHAGEQHD